MRRDKILYLLPYFELGGTERHLVELVKMAINDFSLVVVSPNGRGVSILKEGGIPHVEVPTLTLLNIFRYRSIIKDLILHFKPDIIHIHGAHELVFIVKTIFQDIPVVFTSHGYASRFPLLDYTLSAFICDRYSDKVIVVSRYEREIFLRRGLVPSKIYVIHNGISVEDESLEISIPRGISLKIVTVARLTKAKGIRYLIEAFSQLSKRYRDIGLFIIGEGEEKRSLEGLTYRLDLKNVFFLGGLPNAYRYLRNFDIFVLPSLFESFGISILEAFSNKKPVVATNVGGIPELVVDGETGILVPPRDSKALARAIERLIEDSNLRERIGQNGYNRFLEEFTSGKMYEKTLKVYKSLL